MLILFLRLNTKKYDFQLQSKLNYLSETGFFVFRQLANSSVAVAAKAQQLVFAMINLKMEIQV